ncbi:MAG: hypothetical protein Q7S27_00010, partial [Nanoarchaeota archaeon]|nr:hypothetical protein [Nanoarchaeota archaeon]
EVMPFLNARARITLSELTFNSPQILKNGVKCNATECIIESYANGVLKFTVLGFSTYAVEEGQQAVSPPPSDSGNTGSGDNGGNNGGNSNPPPVQNKSSADNRSVDISVQNPEAETLDVVSIGGGNKEAGRVNVTNGTRIVLEIEGSTEGYIVDFVVEEDHVKIISDGKSYDLSEDSATSIRVGDKDIYLGVRQFGLGNALVVFGVDEQSVISGLKEAQPKLFSYILIGFISIIILVIGLLIYRKIKLWFSQI